MQVVNYFCMFLILVRFWWFTHSFNRTVFFRHQKYWGNVKQFPWSLRSHGRDTHTNKHNVMCCLVLYKMLFCPEAEPDVLSGEGYTGKATHKNCRRPSEECVCARMCVWKIFLNQWLPLLHALWCFLFCSGKFFFKVLVTIL